MLLFIFVLLGLLPTVGGVAPDHGAAQSFIVWQKRNDFPQGPAGRTAFYIWRAQTYRTATGRDLDAVAAQKGKAVGDEFNIWKSNYLKRIRDSRPADDSQRRVQQRRDNTAQQAAHNAARARNGAQLRETQASERLARHSQDVIAGRQIVNQSDVGRVALSRDVAAAETTCSECDAQLLPGEVQNVAGRVCGSLCCGHGKVKLDRVDPPLPWLTKLWHDPSSALAKTLRKFARQLNNALALASQRVSRPNAPPGMVVAPQTVFSPQCPSFCLIVSGRGGWQPSVVIQGKLHHCMGPLLTEDGQEPSFAQMYTYDPAMADSEKEVNLRMAHVYVPDSTSKAEQDRLRELLQMMQAGVQQHNTYVKDFVQVLCPCPHHLHHTVPHVQILTLISSVTTTMTVSRRAP